MYGDALTTKERVKDRLKITKTDFDTLIDNLILAVTARISKMCNRRFTQATFTHELHDGSDLYGTPRQALIVKNAPLGTISSVQYDAGTNGSPDWTDFDEDEYRIDQQLGVLYFVSALPCGKQNIRVTYTGGFSGYSIGVQNYWVIGEDFTDEVDGLQLTFTLPEHADAIQVFADGMLELASNLTFTPGDDTFTFAAGRAPASGLVVNYLRSSTSSDSESWLPPELVEVAEKAVVRTFKKRDAEGRTTEAAGESTTTWAENIFTKEDLATIKNYRRGYNI